MSTILLTGLQPQADSASDYVLAPDAALLVTEHGTGFAFDMRNSFYAISAVGAQMLERTLRLGKSDALSAIAAEYDADPSTIEADLQAFLNDLEARGVILRRDAVAVAKRGSPGANLLARMAKRSLVHLSSPRARASAVLTLARLSFAWFGWDATLKAWKRHITATTAARPDAVDATLGSIDDAVRAMSARLPFGGNCKERALSSWAMARSAGVETALIVGVVQYPLGGHTWCAAKNGAILGDDAHHCALYLPVFRYE